MPQACRSRSQDNNADLETRNVLLEGEILVGCDEHIEV
jgi:hypothetical protein